MVTVAWIIFEIVTLWFTDFLKRRMTPKEQIGLVLLGVLVAVFGGYSEHRDSILMSSLNSQLSNPQTGLIALHDQINKVGIQLASSGKEQAALLKPGLKKQALELASTLISRSTAILVLAGQHLPREQPLPDSAPFDAGYQREIQMETQMAEAANQQSRIDYAKLLNDYKNTYGNQIIAFRQEFIQRGQKDWKDEPYYLNPTGATDIQRIGLELFSHANRLN